MLGVTQPNLTICVGYNVSKTCQLILIISLTDCDHISLTADFNSNYLKLFNPNPRGFYGVGNALGPSPSQQDGSVIQSSNSYREYLGPFIALVGLPFRTFYMV